MIRVKNASCDVQNFAPWELSDPAPLPPGIHKIMFFSEIITNDQRMVIKIWSYPASWALTCIKSLKMYIPRGVESDFCEAYSDHRNEFVLS